MEGGGFPSKLLGWDCWALVEMEFVPYPHSWTLAIGFWLVTWHGLIRAPRTRVPVCRFVLGCARGMLYIGTRRLSAAADAAAADAVAAAAAAAAAAAGSNAILDVFAPVTGVFLARCRASFDLVACGTLVAVM